MPSWEDTLRARQAEVIARQTDDYEEPEGYTPTGLVALASKADAGPVSLSLNDLLAQIRAQQDRIAELERGAASPREVALDPATMALIGQISEAMKRGEPLVPPGTVAGGAPPPPGQEPKPPPPPGL